MTTKESIPWFDLPIAPVGENKHLYISAMSIFPMMADAARGKPHPITFESSGTCVLQEKEVIEKIRDLMGIAVLHYLAHDSSLQGGQYTLGGVDTVIHANLLQSGQWTLSVSSRDHERVSKLVAWIKEALISEAKGSVYSIVHRNDQGAKLQHLGFSGSPLIRENYSDEVLEAIDFVQQNLGSSEPRGRLVILSGETGTGKTHLVRALLDHPQCVFVAIPPSLVPNLVGPDVLPILMDAKETVAKNKTLVLIIEDGDEAILKRDGLTNSAVTSLLTFGDSFFGTALDAHVIVTTNLSKIELDKATVRPGRLARHIQVDALPADHAQRILTRLSDGKKVLPETTKKHTLAELYELAFGSVKKAVSAKKIGFSGG